MPVGAVPGARIASAIARAESMSHNFISKMFGFRGPGVRAIRQHLSESIREVPPPATVRKTKSASWPGMGQCDEMGW
jgi:hypothetical protein